MLHVQGAVQLHSLRDFRCVELEKSIIEKLREVLGKGFTLLQARFQPLRKGLNVRNPLLLVKLRVPATVLEEIISRRFATRMQPYLILSKFTLSSCIMYLMSTSAIFPFSSLSMYSSPKSSTEPRRTTLPA